MGWLVAQDTKTAANTAAIATSRSRAQLFFRIKAEPPAHHLDRLLAPGSIVAYKPLTPGRVPLWEWVGVCLEPFLPGKFPLLLRVQQISDFH